MENSYEQTIFSCNGRYYPSNGEPQNGSIELSTLRLNIPTLWISLSDIDSIQSTTSSDVYGIQITTFSGKTFFFTIDADSDTTDAVVEQIKETVMTARSQKENQEELPIELDQGPQENPPAKGAMFHYIITFPVICYIVMGIGIGLFNNHSTQKAGLVIFILGALAYGILMIMFLYVLLESMTGTYRTNVAILETNKKILHALNKQKK